MQNCHRQRVLSLVCLFCFLLLACRRKPVISEVPTAHAAPRLVQQQRLQRPADAKRPIDDVLSAGKREGERAAAGDNSSADRPTSEKPIPGSTLFQSVPASHSGIDLVFHFPDEASLDFLSDQSSGSGICIGDLDSDDLPDIYVTNYNQGNRLYKNLGEFRFQDITASAGVAGDGRWCAGPSMVDVDNDGDLDLYVCVFDQPNLLFINQGDGTFEEKAEEWGIDFSGASVMMAFADYDLDGDLDGYLVTHRLKRGAKHLLPKNTRDALQRGILDLAPGRAMVTTEYEELFQLVDKGRPGRKELIIAGQRDILYRQDEDGFHVANEPAGIDGFGIGLAAIWWDFNEDNYPDIYVSNDYKGADRLYRNNGDGSFTDVTETLLPHTPWFSMGADIADINNDGFIDLLATDMSGTDHFKQKMAMGDMSEDAWFMELTRPPQYMRNAVYLNRGGGRMLEVAHMVGLANTDWTWSPKFGDLDNDGLVDLFVANGMSRDFTNSDLNEKIRSRHDRGWSKLPVLRQPNLAFRNRRELRFEEVGVAWGLNAMSASYGASLADLDRDGDLDVVVTNFNGPLSLYRNDSQQGESLLVRLQGTKSNRWGVGAKVTLESGQDQQVRYLNSSQGFMSANELLLHFGLGNNDLVDKLTVRWPGGSVQQVAKLRSGHVYTITEPDQADEPKPNPNPALAGEPIFRRETGFDQIWHREQPFDDYQAQPLLPAKLSQLGPGIAVADVDADGRDDFYVGGAAGQPGKLVFHDTVLSQPFLDDAECEDMGALFLDVDGDGDLDLYVVSGGIEAEAGSALLQDRLYLNHGPRRFEKSSRRLPELAESGGHVCAGDYDHDGDLDLFVGGRIIPGQYPLAPPSRILENRRGHFVDVTLKVAPEMIDDRMVTSAIWSDANDDGWIDLLVAQHWGPVEVFTNRQGHFEKQTDLCGLSAYTGWWNGIAGGDVDADGDIDYVVTNQGLNTKYHADPEHPTRLYYGDFDGSGVRRLIEAKYENDVLFPIRGKSCSTAAMPSLQERFPTYRAFASAEFQHIYSPMSIDASISLSATTLESGVFVNDGKAHFSFRPLPRIAQVAPAHGVALMDVDTDGLLDVVLAQNDFSPQRETGRMAGGVSILLRGDGSGSFLPVWPDESGISIAQDARSLAVIDTNADRQPDLLFGVNNRAIVVLENQSSPGSADGRLSIRLAGKRGNPTGIGSQVTVAMEDGTKLVQEKYGGEGYLSQSDRPLSFAHGSSRPQTVEVRWPDGRVSSTPLTSAECTIRQPE